MKTFQPNCPNVVATVTQLDDLDYLNQDSGLDWPDFLEFRLDNLEEYLDRVEETVMALQVLDLGHRYPADTAHLPKHVGSLITARHPAEGGRGDLSEGRRVEIYRRFLKECDIIDTEVRSLAGGGTFKDLVAEAKQNKTVVVGSFHDFTKFPGYQLLSENVDQAFDLGADVAKIAVVVTTFAELNALVELVEAYISRGKAISAMGMGPLGKLSRLVLSKAGSCLNYGYLQTENAAGQWSAAELKGLIKVL